jgi:hypothetical protein
MFILVIILFTPLFLFGFILDFIYLFCFILLLCWVGVHCGIYKGFYNMSNILELTPSTILLFFIFFYSYVHTMFRSFLPPLLPAPSLSPSPPLYQAETILLLSLILLKRAYKQ